MRRIELLDGVRQIQRAFEASHLIDALGEMLNHNGKEASATLLTSMLKALNTYSIEAQAYNETARRITRIFGLEDLEDPANWSQLVLGAGGEGARRNYMQTLQSRALIVKHYLPKVVSLFDGAAVDTAPQASRADGRQVLSVVVIETASQHSTPERLTKMLQSIDSLYEACAVLEGLPADRISVVACDSGEDKSFDFEGAAPAVERLKKVILDLWERVVFYREAQVDKRHDMIVQNLPILAEIKEAEMEGRLGREQAELLRRGVHDGTRKFLESGALIPEIETRAQHDPRHLMKPATRLLVGSERLSEPAPSGTSLSDRERADLMSLLHRDDGAEDLQAVAADIPEGDGAAMFVEEPKPAGGQGKKR